MILQADFTEHSEILMAEFAESATFETLIINSLSFEKMYAISASSTVAPTQWETEAPTPSMDKPYLWMRTITRGTAEDGVTFTHDDRGVVIGVSTSVGEGYSPTAKVTQNANGAVITITDKNGTTTATITNGSKGDTPVKGIDYYTEADKTEMVNAVLAALPAAEGVSY